MLVETIHAVADNQAIDFAVIPASPYLGNHYTEEEKIEIITHHFEKILEAIGMDTDDDSIRKTPHRYAKMLIKELFWGLEKHNFPKITAQENKFNYDQMLIESNISIKSVCEHHFVPILGFCHIAYIPKNKVIGLSKLNRIAQYFASRPQVQERLTRQIRECLCQVLETDDVAVVVDAVHMCVRMRGIQDEKATTRTYDYGGVFLNPEKKAEFSSSIPSLQDLKL